MFKRKIILRGCLLLKLDGHGAGLSAYDTVKEILQSR